MAGFPTVVEKSVFVCVCVCVCVCVWQGEGGSSKFDGGRAWVNTWGKHGGT